MILSKLPRIIDLFVTIFIGIDKSPVEQAPHAAVSMSSLGLGIKLPSAIIVVPWIFAD
tara:strand:+ start:132 stop:305 length:174 start_codon:yes stop_codon:yes gene_type:complete